MRGKITLVTGATDGIGRQTALQLALLGATVIVHGRSAAKTAETAAWIAREAKTDTPATLTADFASLRDVRWLAEEAAGLHGKLDVLVNNAGIYMTERKFTADRIEATFAVNHLAPFLLTNLLLPALAKSDAARVVTVSSIAHNRAILDWHNLQAELSFDPYGTYALSKLANVLFCFELARRVQGASITSTCLHPGVITTKLLMQGFGTTGAPVEDGARTSVFAASSLHMEGVTGEYLVDSKIATASSAARKRENQEKMWEISAGICGLA